MAAMQTAARKAETGHPAVGAKALATVVGAAVIVGVASFATASAHTDPASRTHVLVTLAVTGIALLVSGVLCWAMRPASRIGPMLCVTALLWWLPYLQQAEIDLVATCGYLARDLWLASLVHIVVTYPDGRSAGWTRVIVVLVYLRVLVPNLATALLAPAPPPLQNLNFFNVATEPALVTDIHGVATQYMGWVVSAAVFG
jgi:hypothetical protein